MEIMRREEFLSSIINKQATTNDHVLRIQFELKHGDAENLVGALLDYFIVSDAESSIDRTKVTKDGMFQLDDDWLLFFYDHLEKSVHPCTPLPRSCKSVLTEDVQGTFDFIANPY
ncbi:hypothetical protein PE074_03600 [Wohlfahrtiimonas chitiniclastica]|nr:hypothetical protein [Wohlfahrtiimonas chitiniclastica]WHR56050.1 hypothetical protein PE074_03600 [Wohlfahrtiimonas chitiniclastica]